ncbi:MAG: hypothetical protein KGO81_10125 [Bacteroidota bacterium]|nr:hypothetical protein [Bacteroidota bacterium]
MEENPQQPQPLFKLYKDKAVYIGTFIGGPLVAGYLAAENFKKLGQIDKAKTSWIISICVTIVIFASVFLIPNMDKIPNYLIPLIYTGIARFLVQKFQGSAIKSHIAASGQTYSTWRAVWIGLIGLLGLLLIIFIIILFAMAKTV